jgi:hypothetical protein
MDDDDYEPSDQDDRMSWRNPSKARIRKQKRKEKDSKWY